MMTGQKMAEKLRGLAEKMQSQIDHKKDSNRLTNTRRRQMIAASLMREGEHLIRVQKALLGLAALYEKGDVPEILACFTTKKAIFNATYSSYNCEDEPGEKTPENLALWSLFGERSEEEKKAARLWELEQKVKRLRIPGFFQTPSQVTEKMLDFARIETWHSVLEPSAGAGAIADKLRGLTEHLDCCELSGTLRELLEEKGHSIVSEDFFDLPGEPSYHRILMNPPFEQLVDTEHVRHAYELLLPGGRLISVMSMSSFFNSYTKAKEFREWLETVGGAMEKLPEGSFVPSGTGVSACLVCIDK